MTLLDHVDDFICRHELRNVPGVIAVSGGPDSVALAHICIALRRQSRLYRFVVAHLNHQLRGPESDADEAFVASLPTSWSILTLFVRTQRIDVAGLLKKPSNNLE